MQNVLDGRTPRLEASPAFRPTCAIRARDQQRQLNVDSGRLLRARSGHSRPARRTGHYRPTADVPDQAGTSGEHQKAAADRTRQDDAPAAHV